MNIITYKKRFKKIRHLAQSRVLDLCLGPYICISVNTEWNIFYFLFIKLFQGKVGARTTLFMQNYLFNIVKQRNLWKICTFLFRLRNSRFDIVGVRTWSLVFLSDFTIDNHCYRKTENIRCILTEWAKMTIVIFA